MFALKTFPCPNCHEFINSGMEKCKYCSITIDPQVANAAVELQDRNWLGALGLWLLMLPVVLIMFYSVIFG